VPAVHPQPGASPRAFRLPILACAHCNPLRAMSCKDPPFEGCSYVLTIKSLVANSFPFLGVFPLDACRGSRGWRKWQYDTPSRAARGDGCGASDSCAHDIVSIIIADFRAGGGGACARVPVNLPPCSPDRSGRGSAARVDVPGGHPQVAGESTRSMP